MEVEMTPETDSKEVCVFVCLCVCMDVGAWGAGDGLVSFLSFCFSSVEIPGRRCDMSCWTLAVYCWPVVKL